MKDYRLVFFEDFLNDGALDPKDWNIQVGDKWSNNELQCYRNHLDNCYIKDSKLIIKATLENDGCKYQSARINTKDKHEWMYGRFVIRAKMPKGRGSWPALWFLGKSLSTGVGWPTCGEIDLMEFSGNRPKIIYGSLHSKTYNHKINTERTVKIELDDLSDNFHDYEVIWDEHSISFYVDQLCYGKYLKAPTDTINEWPFDQPFYLIINLAVGGMFGGVVFDSDLPYLFEVDWIKVYQK
jgi:beta-glucanase (GH16 family)